MIGGLRTRRGGEGTNPPGEGGTGLPAVRPAGSRLPAIRTPANWRPEATGRGQLDPIAPSTTELLVPVVVGTRPEAIKLLPIILALRASDWYRPIVVSTGQHHRMVREIFDLAGITTDVSLWVGDGRANLNERVASVMGRFEDFCREWFGYAGQPRDEDIWRGQFPVAVLVHGDTSSALAAALAAFHMRMPVIHVEAGLRTGLNLSPFPEELNRRLISCIAALHLAPTATNQENLVRENIPVNQIFVTGNTGIDALHWATWLQTPFDDPALQELHNGDERIVVVTAHRRENWDGGLDGIAGGVLLLARAHPEVRFVVPLHPNPRVRQQLGERLRDHDNILLIEPLGYAQFSRLLARCYMVLTDSGGIQEEAPSLNKPVLVMRESTERTEGIKAGTLILVGTSPDRIAAEGERLLSDPDAYARMAGAPNPYGDGRASERIVAALEHLRHGGEPPTPFGPGYDRRAVLTAAAYDLDRLEEIESRLAERQAPSDELWPT